MPPILINTNLLVYLYDQNQPARQDRSHRVLEQFGTDPQRTVKCSGLV